MVQKETETEKKTMAQLGEKDQTLKTSKIDNKPQRKLIGLN